jgi:hypothetical protein
MTLDPRRFNDAGAYLSGPHHLWLVEVEAQIQAVRAGYVVAQLELQRQRDDVRIEMWEESVAKQDRAIAVNTRVQHNVVEQCEADLQQLLDERALLMFLIEHP